MPRLSDLASYEVEIPAEVLAALDWDESRDRPHDVSIFVIMTLDGAELSANLRAPVVVHTRSRRAHQLIVDDANCPTSPQPGPCLQSAIFTGTWNAMAP